MATLIQTPDGSSSDLVDGRCDTAFHRDAHAIIRPDGSRVIAVSGAGAYEGNPAYEVTPVRGYDDPAGRGFRVTNEMRSTQ